MIVELAKGYEEKEGPQSKHAHTQVNNINMNSITGKVIWHLYFVI